MGGQVSFQDFSRFQDFSQVSFGGSPVVRDYHVRPMAGITVYSNMVKVHFWCRGQPPNPTGKRGRVNSEFGGKKRRRMMDAINQWRIPSGSDASLFFATLTYPESYPLDWHAWKKDFEAFRRRLLRAFKGVSGIWRIELQQRGAPHYHLVIAVPHFVSLRRMRQWVSIAWAKTYSHVADQYKGAYATNVRLCVTPRHALNYAAKYCNKYTPAPEYLSDSDGIGRQWGIIGAFDRSSSEMVLVHADTAVEYRHGFARLLVLVASSKSSYAARLVLWPDYVNYSVYGLGDSAWPKLVGGTCFKDVMRFFWTKFSLS